MPKPIPLHFECVACQAEINEAEGAQGALAVLILVTEFDAETIVKQLCFSHRRQFERAKAEKG